MGLIDKLKNIFTEEVDEDDEIVKVEQIKKEVRSVPIESPTVEKKEPVRAENKPEFDELALEKEVAMEKPKEETKAVLLNALGWITVAEVVIVLKFVQLLKAFSCMVWINSGKCIWTNEVQLLKVLE